MAAPTLSRAQLTVSRRDATASLAPSWGDRVPDPSPNLHIILGDTLFPTHIERVGHVYRAVDLLTDQVAEGKDVAVAANALVRALQVYFIDLDTHANGLTPRLARHLRVLEQAFRR